jgi:SdrD B-like domain
MRFFTASRRNSGRSTRVSRELQPVVEGCEKRQLLSTGTISGTVVHDLTGNNFSSDDTPFAGVTVNLTKAGSSQVLQSATTASNGTYSFKNLAAGNYLVQQVVPSNHLPTEALNGHSVSLKSGAIVANQNFDDFAFLPTPQLSNVSYIVTTPAGKSKTVSTPNGNVQQGDTLEVKFKLAQTEQLTLVAYGAPNSNFDASNLQQQVIFDKMSTTAAGAGTLTVTIPDGYFQVDFVAGPAIDHLESNENVLYHAQDRFISGGTGGTQTDPLISTPLQVSGTVSSATPVAAPDVTLAAVSDLVSAGNTTERKH